MGEGGGGVGCCGEGGGKKNKSKKENTGTFRPSVSKDMVCVLRCFENIYCDPNMAIIKLVYRAHP